MVSVSPGGLSFRKLSLPGPKLWAETTRDYTLKPFQGVRKVPRRRRIFPPSGMDEVPTQLV